MSVHVMYCEVTALPTHTQVADIVSVDLSVSVHVMYCCEVTALPTHTQVADIVSVVSFSSHSVGSP